MDRLAAGIGNQEGLGWLSFHNHLRLTSGLEVKVHDVVLALGEFQLLVCSLNDVVPQLAIPAGLFNQETEVGDRVIWSYPWEVGSVVYIINKSQLEN